MRLSPEGTTELLSDSMCAKEFGEFFGEAHTFVVLGLVEDNPARFGKCAPNRAGLFSGVPFGTPAAGRRRFITGSEIQDGAMREGHACCGVPTGKAEITASVNCWVVALPARSRVLCLPSR
jgi:hypothetical protein